MSIGTDKTEQIGNFLGEAVSSAIDTLSPILDANVSTECGNPLVKTVASTDFGLLAPALYFGINFSGDVQGKAVAVFREADLAVVLKLLMNSDDEEEIEFDEMSLGMIKEIMSQITASLADNIGDFFGVSISSSISQADSLEDINQVLSALECEEYSETIDISAKYKVGSVINGKVAFVFGEQLVNALGRMCLSETKTDIEEVSHHRNVNHSNINVAPTEFPRFDNTQTVSSSGSYGNMDLLMDVPMNVCVEIGKTRKKMKDIMNFTQGTVITIDKQAGAPVDITVNGQLIARGDVIVIDDNFGVRITEIVNSKGISEN